MDAPTFAEVYDKPLPEVADYLINHMREAFTEHEEGINRAFVMGKEEGISVVIPDDANESVIRAAILLAATKAAERFGRGPHRLGWCMHCWQHPENPDKCISVRRHGHTEVLHLSVSDGTRTEQRFLKVIRDLDGVLVGLVTH